MIVGGGSSCVEDSWFCSPKVEALRLSRAPQFKEAYPILECERVKTAPASPEIRRPGRLEAARLELSQPTGRSAILRLRGRAWWLGAQGASRCFVQFSLKLSAQNLLGKTWSLAGLLES